MTTEPIRLGDRISTVLARDERMLEVLLAASPTFAHLRNPLVRRTMAKLATVEHAARVAGIDANDLLARLNAALLGDAGPIAPPPRPEDSNERGHAPAIVAHARPSDVVDCDVRDDLRAGREPFRRIFDAARGLHDTRLLRLRAIFEPAPLYAVLGRQGLSHFTERLADDDWIVWFWREGEPMGKAAPGSSVDGSRMEGDDLVIDVRGLEPPDPMVRTLEALERLPRGATLVQINVRVPQYLLPKLAERGFTHEVREQSPDLVRIFIRHADVSTHGGHS